MKYIAYGSNMASDQMAYRCPDAHLIGTGRIEGARLAFYLHATVERSTRAGAYVPVAVWDISDEDERNLDYYEGVPTYYSKATWPVVMDDGTKSAGLIYLMQLKRPMPPTAEYYNGIARAYRSLGIEREIDAVLLPALKRASLGSC